MPPRLCENGHIDGMIVAISLENGENLQIEPGKFVFFKNFPYLCSVYSILLLWLYF